MNVGTEHDTHGNPRRRRDDRAKLWGLALQLLPYLLAMFGAFMLIKTDLATLTVRVEAINSSVQRIDSELVRLRESQSGARRGS